MPVIRGLNSLCSFVSLCGNSVACGFLELREPLLHHFLHLAIRKCLICNGPVVGIAPLVKIGNRFPRTCRSLLRLTIPLPILPSAHAASARSTASHGRCTVSPGRWWKPLEGPGRLPPVSRSHALSVSRPPWRVVAHQRRWLPSALRSFVAKSSNPASPQLSLGLQDDLAD
jgi:hypothetical protein